MEKAEIRKEQSDDEDEWGTAPKVAALASASAITATVVASKGQREKTEESDYSADWGENDLVDKTEPT